MDDGPSENRPVADPRPDEPALSWVRDQLPGASLRHLRTRPWGSVWRVDHHGGLWWFKVNHALTVYEPRLLARLAASGSALLTPCLVHPSQPWTLLADAGTSARDRLADADGEGVVDLWVDLLPRYGELQRSIPAEDLRSLGVPDFAPDRLLDAFDARLEDARWFTSEVAPEFSVEERIRLAAARPALAVAAAALADGVAPGVQHDDLHDGNVYVDRGAFRVIDWGDAVVSHPFSTLRVTLGVLANRLELSPEAPALARVRDAYLEPWLGGGESWSALHEQADLAIRTAGLLRADAWARALGGPEAAADLDFAAADAVAWWLLRLADDLS